MTQVWQIAAGTSERNYTDLFLNHDVMFMGPGSYGDYNEKEHLYKQTIVGGVETKNKIGQINSFVQRVKEGDAVLLRNVHEILSIGIVDSSGYEWNNVFDDVFGWDLQHTRRVIWQGHLHKDLQNIQKTKHLFDHMRQVPTFSRVYSKGILDKVNPLIARIRPRSLKDLPSPLPEPLDMDTVGQELFSKGLPNERVDKVLIALQRQRRLVNWYRKDKESSGRPTEHEVVAHMILPLMLALGWSEQLLAVEWRKIDLAAFNRTPTTEENCILVCEAKWLGHGLQNVLDQAKGYTQKHKLTNCRKILLADGARLYLYERVGIDWKNKPVGYLNVNSIRTNHIAPANTNAIDTIVALTPSGIMS